MSADAWFPGLDHNGSRSVKSVVVLVTPRSLLVVAVLSFSEGCDFALKSKASNVVAMFWKGGRSVGGRQLRPKR